MDGHFIDFIWKNVLNLCKFDLGSNFHKHINWTNLDVPVLFELLLFFRQYLTFTSTKMCIWNECLLFSSCCYSSSSSFKYLSVSWKLANMLFGCFVHALSHVIWSLDYTKILIYNTFSTNKFINVQRSVCYWVSSIRNNEALFLSFKGWVM